jgi:hypothetical protein
MMYVKRSLRLYLSNRSYVLFTPMFILLGMTAVSIALALVMGIAWGLPLPADAQEGFRYNQGSIYSIPGFLISLGALAMNRNFAMSLAFGSTRRHFWLGTSIGFVVTALVTAVASVGFLAAELVTNHWFIGARAFDVAILGDGDYRQAFVMIFVLSLLSMFLGALFGTTFRAFGAVWTTVLSIVFGLVLLGLVTITVWQWSTLLPAVTALGLWVAPIVAAIIAVVAASGSYAANRHATV